MASQRNRKRRRKLERKLMLKVDTIKRLRLHGYDPLTHSQTANRFYRQVRMIYFLLWLYKILADFKVINLGDTVRVDANYFLRSGNWHYLVGLRVN